MLFILYTDKMVALLLLNITPHILFIPKKVQTHTFPINGEITVNRAFCWNLSTKRKIN